MVDANVGLMDIGTSNFVATELPQAVDHFICRLCQYIVFQPKECPKCNSVFCHDCNTQFIAKKGKWQCPECMTFDQVTDMHRVVKEILEKLVFQCPKCMSSKRTYTEIFKHAQECQGKDSSVQQESSSINQVMQQAVQQALVGNYPDLQIYVMEKDSRKFYIYNTKTLSVQLMTVQTTTNFPHNFQAIQVGLQTTRVYIVGGGDFNQLPESMFQINEIVAMGPNSPGLYKLQQCSRMQFARHGHSCCSLGETNIVVTGSRKDIDNACKQTEIFNTQTNKWHTLAQMNTGRHYHSSCSFQNKFVYVFCGISNESKKYLNTIERLEVVIPHDPVASLTKKWQLLVVNNQVLLSARQGCGVCEVSSTEILIVGGFHGQFSNETFFYNTTTNSLRKAYNELKDNIFPFQVPTIADPANHSVVTIDWQTYKLYEFKNDQWQFKKKLKNQ